MRISAALTALLLAAATPAGAVSPGTLAEVQRIEKTLPGRIGYAELDLATGQISGHRLTERFAMMSTFKAPLCAAVLARVDAGQERLDRRLTYTAAELVDHSPATARHVATGMTLAELCEATVTQSDNTAANLLLGTIGGPGGMTAFLRSIGDETSRLDRLETAMSEARPGDPRDTTTPEAMARTLHVLLNGTVLSPASRKRLAQWMVDDKVGDALLRASLPAGWYIADKTGSGGHGARGIIAALGPQGRPSRIVAVYIGATDAPLDQRNAAIAAIGAALVKDW